MDNYEDFDLEIRGESVLKNQGGNVALPVVGTDVCTATGCTCYATCMDCSRVQCEPETLSYCRSYCGSACRK